MSHASPEVPAAPEPLPADGTYAAWGAPSAAPAPVAPVATGLQPLPLLAGLAAAIVGALLWAAAVRVTNYEIGFAAIGVGGLVGFTMRRFGAAVSPANVYAAGALALVGVVLGLFAETVAGVSRFYDIGIGTTITHLRWGAVATDLAKDPLHWVFAVMAVFAAFRLLRHR